MNNIAKAALFRALCVTAGGLASIAVEAQAQAQTWRFDQAVYVSCREAQAMTPDQRRSLALFLAEHVARHHGVKVPPDDRGGHLAMLVRGGCTLAPDSHLFAVIDRAIVAERDKLDKR